MIDVLELSRVEKKTTFFEESKKINIHPIVTEMKMKHERKKKKNERMQRDNVIIITNG